MNLSQKKKSELFYNSDKNADGKFLVGVLTTGIYCLPSCTARKPKEKNIKFFNREEEAKEFGLRACKKCHPDLYYKGIDPDLDAARRSVEYIRKNFAKNITLESVSKEVGIGKSKLNEILSSYYQSTFSSILQKSRIAKSLELLGNEKISLLEVAERSGYENQSTFYENFVGLCFLSPNKYRKMLHQNFLEIDLPQDFRVDLFLKHHSWEGDGPDLKLEIDNNSIKINKALFIGPNPFVLKISIESFRAKCIVSGEVPSPATMARVHQILIKSLGLGLNPKRFENKVLENKKLSRLIRNKEGLRLPQTATVYEGIVWVIVGQAVSLAVAHKLRSGLLELCGTNMSNGLIAHPRPQDVIKLSVEDLRSCGFSNSKANYLLDISGKLLDKSLDLKKLEQLSAWEIEKELLALKGFGPWSVNYLMMRCFAFPDCLPLGDTGLRSGVHKFFKLEEKPGQKQIVELMEKFRPFRSLATFHLWMGVED